MSWISDNYEKAAIGGAAVVALALAAVIFKNKGAVEEASVLPSFEKNGDVAVLGLPIITETKTSLGNEHIITQPDDEGRKLNLFTGVPLFAKKDDRKNPVDLPKSPPIHQGMQNTWWLKYGIDPGNSDAPEQDADADGFTNREEYVAETIPTDFASHPDPVSKLKVDSVKTEQVHVRPMAFGEGRYTFRLQTKGGMQLNRMVDPIREGGDIVFRDKKWMQNRFKFIKVENKEIIKSGIRQTIQEWILEDKNTNKKGKRYRVDRRGNPGILDSKIKLTLHALKCEGDSFEVSEGMRFSLPFDAEAKEKPYLLKTVDRENKKIEIEYTDMEGNKIPTFLDF